MSSSQKDQSDAPKQWPIQREGLVWQPLMGELYGILQAYNAIDDFKASINAAIEYNLEDFSDPPPTGLGIQSWEDYVVFMNSLLTWIPTEQKDGHWVYKHLCGFYFVLNQQPISQRTDLQNPINPTSVNQPLKPLTQWILNYANQMGQFLDTTESWNQPGQLASFQAANDLYHLEKYIIPGPGSNFNDFFTRKLKSPNPVASPDDDTVIVSPADCTYASYVVNIRPDDTISLKGLTWNISDLLSNFPRRNEFTGGTFVHAFLGPFDYHRQHAPVSGRVVYTEVIQGQCYLQVTVEDSPSGNGRQRLRPIRPIAPVPGEVQAMDAPDFAGYQFLQSRGLVVIDTQNPKIGLVAVLPIGMCQVSSVNLTVSDVGQPFITKGQEISYFKFGGSDIIMVFQKHANFHLLQDIVDNIINETVGGGQVSYPMNHYIQGQQVGTVG